MIGSREVGPPNGNGDTQAPTASNIRGGIVVPSACTPQDLHMSCRDCLGKANLRLVKYPLPYANPTIGTGTTLLECTSTDWTGISNTDCVDAGPAAASIGTDEWVRFEVTFVAGVAPPSFRDVMYGWSCAAPTP